MIVDVSPEFETLTVAMQERLEAGHLEGALQCADQALRVAESADSDVLLRRAQCNRALILIELGQGASVVALLRSILAETRETEISFRASYALARVYDMRCDRPKAQFYARIALGHAQTLGQPQRLCSAHNQQGSLLIAESRFDQATFHFEEALRFGSPVGTWRALVEDNLGYCYVLTGRTDQGLALLYRSLRTLRRAHAERFEVQPRLSLCFAHLETGRLGYAERHGTRALFLADREGDAESVKAALYLLGETAKQLGDIVRARSYFSRLQARFYPQAPQLPDLLLTVDARQVINLKA